MPSHIQSPPCDIHYFHHSDVNSTCHEVPTIKTNEELTLLSTLQCQEVLRIEINDVLPTQPPLSVCKLPPLSGNWYTPILKEINIVCVEANVSIFGRCLLYSVKSFLISSVNFI